MFSLLGISLVTIFTVGTGYVIYKKNERARQVTWQKLINSLPSEFILNQLGNEFNLTGNYRGYELEIYDQGQIQIKLTPTIKTQSIVTKFLNQPLEVTETLALFTPINTNKLKGWIKATAFGAEIVYQQNRLIKDINYFHFLLDYLSDLADIYPQVIALGSETIPTLRPIATNDHHPLQNLAAQLLQDIGHETEARLHKETAYCRHCMAHAQTFTITLAENGFVSYYACRNCNQSHDFFGRVAAILDNQSNTEKSGADDVLQINWLINRELFNFDEVMIIQATNEEVERFAVQVGNDTNPKQKNRYSKMRCVVSPGCKLSQNTQRILQKMFGYVELTMSL